VRVEREDRDQKGNRLRIVIDSAGIRGFFKGCCNLVANDLGALLRWPTGNLAPVGGLVHVIAANTAESKNLKSVKFVTNPKMAFGR
jgi:hypothetical protein